MHIDKARGREREIKYEQIKGTPLSRGYYATASPTPSPTPELSRIVEESLIDVCQSGILLSFVPQWAWQYSVYVCVYTLCVCVSVGVIIMGHVKPVAIVCDDK